MKRLARCLILLVVAGLPIPLFSGGQSQDEAEIRNLQRRQQEAWNRHDAKAYADLFAESGDVVNVVGWWWKGRPEIESKLTEAYKFVFRESTLTIDEVHVRFLTPEIAVAHVLWSMSGAKTPPGIPEPCKGIQTQVHKCHTRSAVSCRNTGAFSPMSEIKGIQGRPGTMLATETDNRLISS